jgi:GNAT superfamily N-acetyltransferase
MMPAPVIRRVSSAERADVVATVTAAFVDDPAWRFLLNDEYERLASEFVGATFDLRVASGNVWASDDVATVAMWDGPGGDGDPSHLAEETWTRYRALAGEQAHARLADYKSAVASAAPRDPYWYLAVLATHPSRQGEGLASAVLMPIIDEADRDGIACCTETSTEANRRFYARRGFIETTEVALPGGPPTWWLRRGPTVPDEVGAVAEPVRQVEG